MQIASTINEKLCISDSTTTRDSIIDRFALERRKRDAGDEVEGDEERDAEEGDEGNVLFWKH